MKRKDFIKRVTAVAVLGLPVLAVTTSSCSKEESPSPTNNNTNNQNTADCLANGTNTTIESNHGHSLTVSKEDVESATEKTYSIQGTSGHSHSVTISASQFASLKDSNQAIDVVSTSTNGHMHTVTVSCA